MPKTTISAEIEIDAPRERVWEILVDLDRYPAWNPFTRRVESTLEMGASVTMDVQLRPNRRSVQREVVTAIEPMEKVCWGMKILVPWLLAANRCQVLSTTADGGTRYFTADEFRGVLVPLVMWLYRDSVQRGFTGVARALKARAEAGVVG